MFRSFFARMWRLMYTFATGPRRIAHPLSVVRACSVTKKTTSRWLTPYVVRVET